MENTFTVGKDEIYDFYLFSPDKLAYGMLGSYLHTPREESDHPIIDALNALPPLKKLEQNPADKSETGLLIIREEYIKTQINLHENALEVGGAFYELTPEQYAGLKKLTDEAAAQIGPYGDCAQWLVWMNPNRVTGIECVDTTGETFSIGEENLLLAAMEPRYISVSGGKTYTPGSMNFDGMKNAFRAVLTFDNDGTYTIVLHDGNLYLESSDMAVACQYKTNQTAGFIDAMRNAQAGILNPRMGKPVIYLYPEKTTDVSVKLDFKGKLTYTYPAYNGGWDVTAQPDGTLYNKADGSTHYYLFWEGHPNFGDWDFSKGFVVKGTDAEAFLKEKLPALGLTPREYNDFITYWVPQLLQNEYNLITFAYEQYEAVAPLSVYPAPDTVIRIHMVYKPIPYPIDVEEQILPTPPPRKGFTLTEWGGTALKADTMRSATH